MSGNKQSVVVAYKLHEEFRVPLVEIAARMADKSINAFNIYDGTRIMSVNDIKLGEDGWDDLWMECAKWETQDYDMDCVDRLFTIEKWKCIGLGIKDVNSVLRISIGRLKEFAYVFDNEGDERELEEHLNGRSLDKEECQAIAKLLWSKDSSLTNSYIASLLHDEEPVFDDAGLPLKCAWRSGKKAISTIRSWIAEVDLVERRSGRPAKRKTSHN